MPWIPILKTMNSGLIRLLKRLCSLELLVSFLGWMRGEKGSEKDEQFAGQRKQRPVGHACDKVQGKQGTLYKEGKNHLPSKM